MRINVLLFFLKIYSSNLLVRHISLSNMSTAVSGELHCSSLLMDRTTLTRGRRGLWSLFRYLGLPNYYLHCICCKRTLTELSDVQLSNLELQVYCRKMKLNYLKPMGVWEGLALTNQRAGREHHRLFIACDRLILWWPLCHGLGETVK